jgi:hypothetical protein
MDETFSRLNGRIEISEKVLFLVILSEREESNFLTLQRHFFRHSRENGNPGCLSCSKPTWIPAFAGMTGSGSDIFKAARPFLGKVPL